ncbi:MAG: type VI secretion system baseplate subunit TssG [Gemmatimonadetes bacterium]|nr:MAG: type VI secretion system baseplate subunit TssG [Gemmatimonadota bacterium]
MASARRRPQPPLTEALRDEGHAFDFVQAVRLLERLRPDAARPGTVPDADAEAVRFRSYVGLAFPASDLVSVTLPGSGEGARAQPVVEVAFVGLAGLQGPLPRPDTELLLERIRDGDTAFRDFLDIIHHRLLAFAYRGRVERRTGLALDTPDDTAVGRLALDLAGVGTEAFRRHLADEVEVLLPSAGLRVGPRRTAAGLERLLFTVLGVRARVRQFVGRWIGLEPGQQARITRDRTATARLGHDSVLGARFWDQSAGVDIELGPLTLERFERFLPGGAEHGRVAAVVRRYVEPGLAVRLRLRLERDQVPPAALVGGPPAADGHRPVRLGWTTWLRAGRVRTDHPEIVLDLGAGAA